LQFNFSAYFKYTYNTFFILLKRRYKKWQYGNVQAAAMKKKADANLKNVIAVLKTASRKNK
jgi:hypothetical protein